MTIARKLIALVSLVCGLLLLHFTMKLARDSEWTPVQLPLPGVGISLSFPFDIVSGGRFQLTIDTPLLPSDRKPTGRGKIIPAIPCDLELQITNEGKFRIDRNIKYLEHYGWNYSAGLDTFSSEVLELPGRGDYILHITNRMNVERFCQNGAMIQLTRSENPLEALRRYWCFEALAYALIAVSVIFFMWGPRKRKA
jgi:hypothetical protein